MATYKLVVNIILAIPPETLQKIEVILESLPPCYAADVMMNFNLGLCGSIYQCLHSLWMAHYKMLCDCWQLLYSYALPIIAG